MKVRISYIVDVDDDQRRSIRETYDPRDERPGLASRQEIQQFFWSYGEAGTIMLDDLTDARYDREETEKNLASCE